MVERLHYCCTCYIYELLYDRGVVRRRWRPLTSDVQCAVELALEANHVTVNNEQKSGVTITEEVVNLMI